jgi:GNAT superfamily N-acetyltransferase
MVASKHSNPVTYFVQQSVTVLRTQGLASLVKRIRDHLQSHQFVYGSKNCPEFPTPICELDLELKEITAADGDEIDGLTAIDEWAISKSVTLKKLEEGEHIYIAKHKGQIVGTVSVVTKEKFEDPILGREFRLARDEAYCWRAFCVPAFRGRGIIQALEKYYQSDLALKYGRNNTLVLIRTSNKSSQRLSWKSGRIKVGRAGFVGIFGIQFHYLWGREAFKETQQRFLIQKRRPVSLG